MRLLPIFLQMFLIPLAVGVIASGVFYYATLDPSSSFYVLSAIFVAGASIYAVTRLLNLVYLRANRTGIVGVYRNQASAQRAILRRLRFGQEVDVLAVRGLGIASLRDSLVQRSVRQSGREIKLRVAYLSGTSGFCAQRAREIGEERDGFTGSLLTGYTGLLPLFTTAGVNAELRVYNDLPIWRLIRIDDTIFVSGFISGLNGHESPVYEVRRDSINSLFPVFKRQFEHIWTSSIPYQIEKSYAGSRIEVRGAVAVEGQKRTRSKNRRQTGDIS